MATEVLIPMGAHKAFAASDMVAGRLFKWSTAEETVTYTTQGDRPLGIITADVYAGEILSAQGGAEWFDKAGKLRVPLDFTPSIGDEVQAGDNGTIEAHAAGYALGVVVSSTNADSEYEIWIY